MGMTKDQAYQYARRIRRLNLTKMQLEARMRAEGYNHEAIRMVRDWLNNRASGKR